jgi:hypothetical protein
MYQKGIIDDLVVGGLEGERNLAAEQISSDQRRD